MSPQHKGVVPDKHAQRLVAAGEALEAALAERDAAVLAALKAGGSTREIGALVGLTGTAVLLIGRRAGWPDAKELARRAEVEKERHRFDWMLGVEPESGG